MRQGHASATFLAEPRAQPAQAGSRDPRGVLRSPMQVVTPTWSIALGPRALLEHLALERLTAPRRRLALGGGPRGEGRWGGYDSRLSAYFGCGPVTREHF